MWYGHGNEVYNLDLAKAVVLRNGVLEGMEGLWVVKAIYEKDYMPILSTSPSIEEAKKKYSKIQKMLIGPVEKDPKDYEFLHECLRHDGKQTYCGMYRDGMCADSLAVAMEYCEGK